MKKTTKVLAVSCVFMTFAGSMPALAAMNLETESPVAGGAITLNNYFAKSLNPEEDLVKVVSFASSQNGLQPQAQAEPQMDVSSQPIKAQTSESDVPQVTAMASIYENIAISQVSDYVNIRKEPNTSSEVVGKIYNNCAATIQSTVDGDGGKWYQIQSGNVTGYIKAQYFITGAQAESVAKQVGTVYATVVGTTSLRLRQNPDLNSHTLTLLAEGAKYAVIQEEGDFVKLAVDTDLEGYVYKEYIKTDVDFKQAVSLSEEEAKKQEDARLKKEADEALKKLEDLKKEEAKKQTSGAKETTTAKPPQTEAPTTAKPAVSDGTIAANPEGAGNSQTAAPPTQAPETKVPETKASETKTPSPAPGSNGPGGTSSNEVTSATRDAIVAYSRQFLGGPYVYGGTSLTEGADCSGFTQAIFAHFGISTGRSSRDQAAKGKEIPVSDVKPGDLLFYASGNYINHVALYIGGGQIIHASTPATGICLAPANYRTPCKAVTFLD